MQNIFNDAPEFINSDNRKLRAEFTTSFQSIYYRLESQLPVDSIQNKTILDLGSCIGAAGYYSLKNGAKFYTGVEIQDYYVNTSKSLLSKYFQNNQFNIIQQDILKFLDDCIEANIKFDFVLAAGILYEFLDPISFLQKVCKVSTDTVVIDTKWIPPGRQRIGIVALIPNEAMVKGIDAETYSVVHGAGARMCQNAIDIVMSTESFKREGDIIKPKPILDADDPYNCDHVHHDGWTGPKKIIVKYKKNDSRLKTLNEELVG